MANSNQGRPLRYAGNWGRAFILAGALGLGWVLGRTCISQLYATVHFGEAVDFGAPPPPLQVPAWGEDSPRNVVQSNGDETDYGLVQRREEQAKIDRAAAVAAEGREDVPAAIAAWRAYADQFPADRESALDRAEVLQLPASAERSAYLASRPKAERESLARLADQKGPLQAHALYALGSINFDAGKLSEASGFYDRCAALPSPRREAALIMLVRCLLASSLESPEKWLSMSPSEADLKRATTALAELEGGFPKGRFARLIPGWRARIEFVSRRYPEALLSYLRLLDQTTEVDERVSLLSSIRYTSRRLGTDGAMKVRTALLADPSLLPPYLNYRVYHSSAAAADLGSLAELTQDMMRRHPDLALKPELLARLSEIAYLRGDPSAALALADESLATSAKDRRRDLATYVRAGSLRKLGRASEAMTALKDFETKFVGSYLIPFARENRALILEQGGDFGSALDEYRRLGYDTDVAYVADVRMNPEALAQYARQRPEDPQLSRWKFALGLRYLRADRFDEAIAVLSHLSPAERKKLGAVGSRNYAWFTSGNSTDVLRDPLLTAQELKRKNAAIALAANPAAKAKLLYDLAGTYYTRRNLLLYNPDLWQGSRNFSLGALWNGKIATAEDEAAMKRHHFEHECLNRARTYAYRAAMLDPKSPIAAKALYRSACANRRLATFNPWWRKEAKSLALWANASSLLKRVYTAYPTDPLAKAARKFEKVFINEARDAMNATLFRQDAVLGDQAEPSRGDAQAVQG